MNISLKQVNRICLGIVVVVSLACGYLTVSHVIKKRRQFGIEKGILSKRIKEVNLAATSLEELKAVLAETKKELHYLNERIPESGKIGLLLKQIDSLMKQRKIALISLQPLPVREEKIYLKNPIQLKFTGNFVDIYHLLHDLETMNRIVVMEKLAISRQERSEQCRVELMVNVFEQKKTDNILKISNL
jgi:Tfp pilus assembly protein PilO